MKYFMTGISGFIGNALARQLVTDGQQVSAIIRSTRLNGLQQMKGIQFYPGDLHEMQVLEEAMKGCEAAFHLAALAKPWVKDPGEFHRVNVEGTVNVLEAARRAGVKRVVFTASAATMSSSVQDEPVDEDTFRKMPFFNLYESTKAEAEAKAREFCKKGLEVVIVNPSRVFGPGILSKSNSVTRMIAGYAKGSWRIIPGNGKKIGNYVYIDDVVHGHILAAQKGKPGERYILGGENLSFGEFFSRLARLSGKQRKMMHLPLAAMTPIAGLMEWQSRITGIPPLITSDFVKKYMHNWILSSAKAIQELGYRITPFNSGVKRTLEWLNETNN
jgi:nucleoside-diphosphate-sugar epimerase